MVAWKLRTFMTGKKIRRLALALACVCGLASTARPAAAQSTAEAIHEVEVTLKSADGQAGGVRVRLVKQASRVAVAETFSGQGGQVRFANLSPGEYLVETIESDKFEATSTGVSILPAVFRKPRPQRVNVRVDLTVRKQPGLPPPGVVAADVDVYVPEDALKRYRKGAEALRSGKAAEAVREFKAAVEVYPKFYTARLELGRGLRALKRYAEAEEALRPLGEMAPRRAEARIEYAIILLALNRMKEAAAGLRQALQLEESNWVTHLHLGWALLEAEPDEAARHFTRALELDERRAAQAHLSLARIYNSRRARQETVRHLEAYLALAPDAPDASAVRKLLNQLRR
jgi:tetratricopeptide (TPR) repeat protein